MECYALVSIQDSKLPANPARHRSQQKPQYSRQSVCHGYAPPSGRFSWTHGKLGTKVSRITAKPDPHLSTAHARPKGRVSGAHAHGTRSGASGEVSAGDSSHGKRWRAGGYAKGVRAKFRYRVARSEEMVVLNFDLTPFASLKRWSS